MTGLARTVLLTALCFAGAFAKSTECLQCEFLVDALHKDWRENSTENEVGKIAEFVCVEFKIEDNFVCDGIVGDFRDEIMYILGQIILEPHQICGLLMQDCGTFFDPFNATWSIPMPPNQPTPIVKQPVPTGKPTLRVLHLSDVHMDTQYVVGAEVQCGEPQCCRPLDDPIEATRRKRDTVKQPAGKWGTVGNCDTPYWTLTNMLQFIQTNHKDIDYVLVSGDLESHAVYEYTQQIHAAMVTNISNTIRTYFPTTPVYFAVGNHEGVPIDNFAPHFAPKQFQMDWLYDTFATAWQGWVPQDQMKSLKYRGCYMVKPFDGLRIISINNPLGGDPINLWMYMNQTDPDGTLTWVIDQLLDAEQAGDKVHIVAHIPGGDGEALEGWALNYYQTYNRFQNTIAGQFFGHTHSDEFYMIYDNPKDQTSRPTGVVYSAPSVTTYSEYHPAYRIYTIDGKYSGSSYSVIDYEEWFLNLTDANASGNAVWRQLFSSVNQIYGINSQIPSEYNNLINRMKTDDNLFQTYWQIRARRNSYDGLRTCTGNCTMDQLCSFRKFHHEAQLCSDLTGANTQPRKPMYRKESKAKPLSGIDLVSGMRTRFRTFLSKNQKT